MIIIIVGSINVYLFSHAFRDLPSRFYHPFLFIPKIKPKLLMSPRTRFEMSREYVVARSLRMLTG